MCRRSRTVRCLCFLLTMALLANFGLMTKCNFLPQLTTATNTATATSIIMKSDVTSTTRPEAISETFERDERSPTLQLQSASIDESSTNLSEPFPVVSTTNNVIQRTMRFGKHWRPLPDKEYKIPFPVFLASLPKSGTTSIHAYFRCGRVRSVHTYCPKKDPTDGGMARLGVLVEENVKQGLPPFQGCGDNNSSDVRGVAKVFTDAGYVLPDGPCYYPSVSALDALYRSYPNMTIMLSTRNSNSWFASLQGWHGGYFVQQLIQFCDFIPRNNTMEAFVDFYNKHNDRVRQFAKQHPSITYVEFAIDSPTAGENLEQITGIPSSCWGKHLPGKKSINDVVNSGKKRKRRKPKAIA